MQAVCCTCCPLSWGHKSFYCSKKQRFGLERGAGDWNNGKDLENEQVVHSIAKMNSQNKL